MDRTDSSRSRIDRKVWTRVQQLQRRGPRDATGRFWIEGIRQLVQACDAGFEFETLLVSRILLQHGLAQKLVRMLVARGVQRIYLSPEQFRSISTAQHASGVAAIVRQRWVPLRDADPQRGLGWLVIERLRSTGNLGTILRTAEATGMGGVIFVGPGCDPYDPRVIRASMGGIFHLHLVRTSPPRLSRWVEENGVHLLGLAPRAPLRWTEIPHQGRIALLIGEERQGLSDQMLGRCHATIRLPMSGRADSLNVAVAAGVMMYELVRRCLAEGRFEEGSLTPVAPGG